jgi:hypothetical protein
VKKWVAFFVLIFGLVVCAFSQVNLTLNPPPSDPTPKKTRPTSKTLTGTVTDKADQPIAGARVYLKNSKTLVVKSFFSEENGTYRFPQLALNTDYEIWAEKDGKKSDSKSVSQFDDRYTPTVNLRIDLNK